MRENVHGHWIEVHSSFAVIATGRADSKLMSIIVRFARTFLLCMWSSSSAAEVHHLFASHLQNFQRRRCKQNNCLDSAIDIKWPILNSSGNLLHNKRAASNLTLKWLAEIRKKSHLWFMFNQHQRINQNDYDVSGSFISYQPNEEQNFKLFFSGACQWQRLHENKAINVWVKRR